MSIIKKKTFRVRKIRKVGGVWQLFLKDKNAKPLEFSVDKIEGELPPVWKFPWQCHELIIGTVVEKCICYLEMDGKILFNLDESDYPDDVKKEITRLKKIDKKIEQWERERLEELKKQIVEYLPQVPTVKNLEDEINKLHMCWKRYLQMLLPMQYQGPEQERRLRLMYWLITIADRLYRRHVDMESPSPLGITFAYAEFAMRELISQDWDDVVIGAFEQNPEYRNDEVFCFYDEVEQELKRVMPPMEKRLLIYCNLVIHQLLSAFANDFAELVIHRSRDLFGDTINNDGEAYRYLVTKMQLPKLSSYIIEKSLSGKEIEDFLYRCF